MIKIENKTIIDYINNKEIENKKELENNFEFMLTAIKYSGNKEIYNKCSKNLKMNMILLKL